MRVRQPSQENEPPTTLSGHSFEIYAQAVGSKQEVNQFQQPITITVAYDPDSLWGPEQGLQLFYYDEAAQDWRILPSWVDEENDLLYATSDHLTVFDYTIQTMDSARTPTLESFQVANYTGAATYSLPITTPYGLFILLPYLTAVLCWLLTKRKEKQDGWYDELLFSFSATSLYWTRRGLIVVV